MKIKRIILIFPPSDVKGVGMENSFIPNGILTIATYILSKNKKYIIKIIDGSITKYTDILKKIDKFKPDLVGLSVLTGNYKTGRKILKYAKSKNKITVIGNHHANYLFNQLIKNNNFGIKYVDYVIRGERGEFTFYKLLKAINNNYNNIAHISDLAYKAKNGFIINQTFEKYPAFKNLIEPNTDLIEEKDKYIKNYNKIFIKFHRQKINPININYIKGCLQGVTSPCIYCCLKDHKINYLEPKEYWKRITKLYKKGYNFFFETCNSLSTMDKIKINSKESYLKKLADTKPKELKRVEFMVYANATHITKNVIKHFKKINVKRIIFGFDSGYEKTLNKICKKNSVSNYNCSKLLNDNKIQIYGCYVAGAENETKKSMSVTYKQIKKICNLKYCSVIEYTSLAPMPGSKAWKLIEENVKNKEVINVEDISKIWVDKIVKNINWSEIEKNKMKIKKLCERKKIVFGGYY